MNVVCFDTHILIWGIKGEAKDGQEDNIVKAKYLIESCKNNNIIMIIPALVLGELLCAIPNERANEFIQKINQYFRIIPFDVKASLIFAEIFKSQPKNKHQELEISRQHFKVDQMIVATAIASNAGCIYSEDKALRKFGSQYLSIYGLPQINEPILIR